MAVKCCHYLLGSQLSLIRDVLFFVASCHQSFFQFAFFPVETYGPESFWGLANRLTHVYLLMYYNEIIDDENMWQNGSV